MTSPHPRTYIAVVGGGRASASECELARRVGRAVAEAGAVLVCGGLGGAMEAACAGAHEAGGLTLGLLPDADRRAANAHLDLSVPTGMGEARNALVVRSADALIAVSGEFGTLSEIALALATGVPVVGLGTWELVKDGRNVDAVVRANTPEDAVQLAIDLVPTSTSRRS